MFVKDRKETKEFISKYGFSDEFLKKKSSKEIQTIMKDFKQKEKIKQGVKDGSKTKPSKKS
jgi:hypothetical protein